MGKTANRPVTNVVTGLPIPSERLAECAPAGTNRVTSGFPGDMRVAIFGPPQKRSFCGEQVRLPIDQLKSYLAEKLAY